MFPVVAKLRAAEKHQRYEKQKKDNLITASFLAVLNKKQYVFKKPYILSF